MESGCVFCKIIAGKIPCHKIFESEHILAFLDISPLSRGHALIVPKQHAVKLPDVSDDALQEMMPAAKKIARAIGVLDFNLLQNNGRMAHQEVEHVHLHVIPKRDLNDGLGIKWESISINQEELEKIAKDIKLKLNQ